jgi:hypothetical protein
MNWATVQARMFVHSSLDSPFDIDTLEPLEGELKAIRLTGGGWRTPSDPQAPFLLV